MSDTQTVDIIYRYYPDLTAEQRSQFAALNDLYHDWNSKINVISRKDIDNLYEHHVLHSLAIADFIHFQPATRIMDIGTGGGFPGIPLAIMFPEAQFHLIDSVGKKIRVCNEIVGALGLTNVTTQQARAEEVKLPKFNFIVSRAVMPMSDLLKIAQRHLSKVSNNALPNGLIALKGGELEQELASLNRKTLSTPVSAFFKEEYFIGKHVVYMQI